MNKLKFLVVALFATLSVAMVSCSDDDDYNRFGDLPANVQKAFSDKYPEGHVSTWQRKGKYYVLLFTQKNSFSRGWFDQADWHMTETKIRTENLPKAVSDSLKAGEYAKWRIDDVERIERLNLPTLYIIEVDNGRVEIDLYYLEDGTLLKENADDDSDNSSLPQVPSEIMKVIEEMYPGASVLDVESEKNGYEVEIIHENVDMEVKFDRDYKWTYTKWDSAPGELSDAILNYLANNYPDYELDDVEIYNTAAVGLYFKIELKKDSKKVELKIKANGEIIK